MKVTAELVFSSDSLGYQEVLDDFPRAKRIYILTYSISPSGADLLNRLRALDEGTIVNIVSNTPGRWPRYWSSTPRDTASKNIKSYMSELNPRSFRPLVRTFFNFRNHAKLIATENIAYVGSANFSDESKKNYEAGFLVCGEAEVAQLIEQVFDPVRSSATEFIPDDEDGLRVPLAYARDHLEAAIVAFEECFGLDDRFSGDDEQRTFAPQGGSPGTEDLEEAHDVLLALLEEGAVSPGAASLLRAHLDDNTIRALIASCGKETALGKLLRFRASEHMQSTVEKATWACDEHLAGVQEAAAQDAYEELNKRFHAAGKEAVGTYFRGMTELIARVEAAASKLTDVLKNSKEIDNTTLPAQPDPHNSAK